MNKFFTFLLLLLLLLIGIISAFEVKWHFEKKQIMERCIGYDPEWFGAWWGGEDCYGVILMSFNENNGGYNLENNIVRGWIVAKINNLDDFYLKDGNMYLVNKRSAKCGDNLMPQKYCIDLLVDGERKVNYYDTAEQVPRYLIIDTKTGNEKFYVKLEEATLAEQQIFLILKENSGGGNGDSRD